MNEFKNTLFVSFSGSGLRIKILKLQAVRAQSKIFDSELSFSDISGTSVIA